MSKNLLQIIFCLVLLLSANSFAREKYLFVASDKSGKLIYLIDGEKIQSNKILDRLVEISVKKKNDEIVDLWLIVSSEIKLKDWLQVRGLLSKAGKFGEKCYVYEPATKKVIQLAQVGPSEYFEWLALDIEKAAIAK